MSKALVGLTSQFDVVGCRAMHIGYGFRLSERPQVLTISPDGYKCTCAVFLNRPSVPFQHIFGSTVPLRACWQGEEKWRTDFFPLIMASRSTPWLSPGPTPYHCRSLVEQWIYSRVLTHWTTPRWQAGSSHRSIKLTICWQWNGGFLVFKQIGQSARHHVCVQQNHPPWRFPSWLGSDSETSS